VLPFQPEFISSKDVKKMFTQWSSKMFRASQRIAELEHQNRELHGIVDTLLSQLGSPLSEA